MNGTVFSASHWCKIMYIICASLTGAALFISRRHKSDAASCESEHAGISKGEGFYFLNDCFTLLRERASYKVFQSLSLTLGFFVSPVAQHGRAPWWNIKHHLWLLRLLWLQLWGQWGGKICANSADPSCLLRGAHPGSIWEYIALGSPGSEDAVMESIRHLYSPPGCCRPSASSDFAHPGCRGRLVFRVLWSFLQDLWGSFPCECCVKLKVKVKVRSLDPLQQCSCGILCKIEDMYKGKVTLKLYLWGFF